RGAVAKRLGVSIATVRRYEQTQLTPITDGKGERRFDPVEVEALVEKRKHGVKRRGGRRARANATRPVTKATTPHQPRVSGAIAKRAFELFEEGATPAKVVMDLGEGV